ncbi:hypothetical protein Gotur_025389 [Gossypium turneri]
MFFFCGYGDVGKGCADALKQASGRIIVSNKNTIMFNHIRKMENNGDHFDKEIDMHGLENYPDVKRITVKPQTRRWIFPETNIGITELAEGHLMNFPSFVMSWWFRNQVMVELKLWKVKRGRNRGVMKI